MRSKTDDGVIIKNGMMVYASGLKTLRGFKVIEVDGYWGGRGEVKYESPIGGTGHAYLRNSGLYSTKEAAREARIRSLSERLVRLKSQAKKAHDEILSLQAEARLKVWR